MPKKQTEISEKQKEILIFIEKEVHRRSIPPAVREIGKEVGLKSTSTVHAHLSKLEKFGYIKRDKTKPRSIEILIPSGEVKPKNNVIPFPNPDVVNIPLIGKVTAGEPILAYEEYDEHFPLPASFVDNGTYYMLRVSGDSMIEAGILDRDYVLVKQQSDAKNGDIVVAMIEDSATVKTYYREANRIRLQPENEALLPIYAKEVEILGLVKGVFRRM